MERLKAEREMILGLLGSCNEKLKREPDNLGIVKLRGIIYIVGQEYDKAISDLDRIISNMPGDEVAYYLRSGCHFDKGEYDLAKRDYLRALKLNLKDDEEFVKGHTEQVILQATMDSEAEKTTIKKILDFEKERVLFELVPELNMTK